MTKPMLGATPGKTGADVRLWSHHASLVELCLFDDRGETELARLSMTRGDGDVHHVYVDGMKEGARYGFRIHGPYDPAEGHWYDPAKLLVDPYATELDRPFVYDPRLGQFGIDTADLMPKAILKAHKSLKPMMPLGERTGFIYEVNVKALTMLHPDVPDGQRGTLSALAHPAILSHLRRIGVDMVELMPITAWIDERHLPPLGLTNSWGYNPVAMMALDPRLVPGGVKELRDTVAALHAEGIGVILDLVFNHTGESDVMGTTLSLRGIDNRSLFRHVADDPGTLVNDTGCGNTLACDHPFVRQLIVDTLRHFVLSAGVDGFRFDLAPIMGRHWDGFHRDAPTLRAILKDEVLEDRILIAEPWDIGLGGYQLGRFPPAFLEWNDRARDTFRRHWRGDAGTTGDLATALAGSADLFAHDGHGQTRSVNFIAAHDGFSLYDLVSYEHKHNEANGEENRDGHNENHSWNNGVEGETSDKAILKKRRQDVEALLSTLFASRGAVMLTAGDEFGRTQHGNNNAYCQDNALTWLDWSRADEALIETTARLAAMRQRFSCFMDPSVLTGENDVAWLNMEGQPMTVQDWETPDLGAFAMMLASIDRETGKDCHIAVLFNRSSDAQEFALPAAEKRKWRLLETGRSASRISVKARSVDIWVRA
ncbi:glycogen operon protein [Rhizobium rosettiformans]|uniref:Glycogen debranching protein GlgX n=2 Tax=Rhizobium rosettiformans TaxID=1368430 RepID=A0A4S8QDD0_9HYPH|nr:glycogen debranching protein GlgX [Rhizobium rosettiformans]MBB5275018.1 glycogen operon protein [Rhizobium rosettiformans]THV39149.1 glycogen debranching protein GlgX [Rhizobium rosettiformans W3]